MSSVTIATFNCENLFRRFKFSSKLSAAGIDKALHDGFIINKETLETIRLNEREITAKAIKATRADIVCLQEVENMDTLKNFVSSFLGSAGYKYKLLIDGNDPRLIDVAILSKIPFDSVQTHQFLRKGTSAVFSRDCLEVNFTINGKPLTVLVNHFKSMFMKGNFTPAQKRSKTAARRKLQSQTVAQLLQKKFGTNPGASNWVVVGDLNDYPDSKCSLKELINQPWIENIVQTRITNETDKWTHFWDETTIEESERYKQLDYILLSEQLAQNNPTAIPVIVRNGLVTKANRYTGNRFTGVTEKQGASDHCPVAVTLTL
jgi:endonuclease/exonuclease/phosphatase family metal-dependent hydrolase